MKKTIQQKIVFRLALILLFSLSVQLASSQATQWAWMNGPNTPDDDVGNYGAMGFPGAFNTPPARYVASHWTDNNGKFWIYGGYETVGGNTYNDTWMFDPTTNMWTWENGPNAPNNTVTWGTMGVPAASNNPGPRKYGTINWVDNSNNLWMFGGFDTFFGATADLWMFNTTTMQWTWMKGPQTNFYGGSWGTMGVTVAANNPSYRFECNASWTDANGDLWFFGGQGNGEYNDLWRFNIASNNWTWMNGSQWNNPAGWYGTQGVASPANQPPGRMVFASWKDLAGNFWIFGGNDSSFFTGGGMLNDLWKYDPVAAQWTWMNGSSLINQPSVSGGSCAPSTANSPSGRIETRANWTDYCGNFWLLGGSDDIKGAKSTNDLWTYNPNTNMWSWVSGATTYLQAGVYGVKTVPAAGNIPGARIGACSFKGKDGIWLFGGGVNNGQHYYSDMWKYYPDKPTPAFTVSPNTGCGPLLSTFTNTTVQNCGSMGVYSWNFGDPASGGANTSTAFNATHSFASAGTYTVKLVTQNCFGTKDSLTHTVTVTSGFTFSTSSTNSNCGPSNGSASTTITSGSGPFTYTWSNAGTGTSITNVPPATYTVTINAPGGCTGNASITVNPGTAAPSTSAITGTSPVCANATGVVFSVTNTPGSTYNWSVPAGATITAGQTTNSITVTFGATSGTVSCTETNLCGPGTPVTYNVTVTPLPVTSAITGLNPVCANSTGVTYTVTNHPGDTYVWTVPPGGTITSGQGTNTITVSWATSGGSITCTESNACGAGNTSTMANVTVTPVPTSSAITGTNPVCANATGVVYSVTNHAGDTYVWSVPAGATITAGAGTNSITVSWGATGGTVSCTESNLCGPGTAVTMNVTITPVPSTSVISGTNPVCPNATGVVYSVTNTPGDTYVWSVPAGATITGGQGTNSITVNWGASGGTVSCTESNLCGPGTAVTMNVTMTSLPITSSITGLNPVCANSTGVTYTVTNHPGDTYVWTVPPGGTITSGQGTNTITVSWATSGGNITCTESNSCGAGTTSTMANVSVTPVPTSSSITGTNPVCPNATGVTYNVTNNAGDTYVWSVPAGANITGGQGTNSITVDWGATGGTVSCTESNSCGPGAPVTMNVTITSLPVSSAITGTTPVCPNASGVVYSVTNNPGDTYNWTVPAGATISSGQGSNSITVNWGATGGVVTCTESNSCGPGAAVNMTVTITTLPVTSAITGTTPVCPNAAGMIYTVTNNPGDTYNWSVPAGATITSGQGSNSITVTFGPAGGTISCTESNTCGSGTAVNFNVVTSSTPVTSAITGTNPVCPNAVGMIYSVVNTPGSTYNWTVPAGATITSGQGSNQITVSFGPAGGTISCTETNSCGTGAAVTINVTTSTTPITSAVTGTSPVCPNATGVVYSVVNTPGSTYNWTVPAGATITAGQGTNSITVNWGATGGSVSCTETNSCGTGAPVTFPVTITPPPATSAITGTSPVCSGVTGLTYSVTNTPGSTYNWTVPAGAAITAGQGTNAITVNWGATGGTISCTETNTCGSGAAVTFNVIVNAAPIASAITGTSPLCPGATGIIYSVSSNPGTTFTWTVPAGATLVSGQGTDSISVNWLATGGTISCTESNTCGSAAVVTMNVVMGALPHTAPITGSTPVCPNAAGIIYSVTNTPGSTYNWTVPAGATITGGQGTNSITVTFGPGGGTVACTETTTCGSGPAVTFNVTTSPIPVTSAITGNNPVCPNTAGVVYSVTNTPGSTYNWAVPAGATIVSGQGTNSITVNWGPSAGTISCTETSSCGTGVPVTINVTNSPPPVTSAITGPSPLCPNTTGIYAVLNNPGSVYAWTVPAGATIQSGQGTDSITVLWGTTGGNITCTQTNSCGSAAPVTFTMTVGSLPLTSAITGPTNICANATGQTFSVVNTPGSTYTWTVPAGSTIVSGQGTNSVFVNAGATGGTVTCMETNGCGSDQVTLNFTLMNIPTLAITGGSSTCKGDSVLLSASGGGPYTWSTGAVANSIYATATGTYTVLASNMCGTSTASTNVTIHSVSASFTTDSTSGNAPLTVHFTDTTSTAGTVWTWVFGDGTTGSGANPSHTYGAAGTYTATVNVTDANGCTATHQVIIVVSDVNSSLQIPNVFTPNGDGSNDLFLVVGKGIGQFDMKIFDRWGVLMNESFSLSQGWDGRTIAGEVASNGTYFYVITANGLDGKVYNEKGYLQLIH